MAHVCEELLLQFYTVGWHGFCCFHTQAGPVGTLETIAGHEVGLACSWSLALGHSKDAENELEREGGSVRRSGIEDRTGAWNGVTAMHCRVVCGCFVG